MKKLLLMIMSITFLFAQCCYSSEIMQRGDSGDEIKAIQERLIELGYLDGTADGAFGAMTENAVISFQKDNELDATGIVGDATYKALLGSSSDGAFVVPDVEISEHTGSFPSEKTLALEIFITIQSAGRTLGYITQNNNPDLSFDVSSQTLEQIIIYMTYFADCDENTAKEPLEKYTDKLVEVICDSFPGINFEKMWFCWCIPAIDETNLYTATYWVKKTNGVLERQEGEGSIYPSTTSETKIDWAEIIKNVTSSSLENDTEIIYDATLDFGSQGPAVFVSEDVMDRFMRASVDNNQGTINELFSSGQATVVPNGTKCNIVKTTFTRCQVKLLEGDNAGKTVWTVIEALKRK